MSKFMLGFLTASLLWGAMAYLHVVGILEWPGAQVPVVEAPEVEPEPEAEPTKRGRRRRGNRGTRHARKNQAPTGTATTGDELGEDDPRTIDVGGTGGEEQLLSQEIEQGMDDAFGRIRRCLVLAAGDDPVSGRLVFGMRIEPDGSVSRVNLRGPAVVTTGDAGSCLRSAARSARFRSFDGPPMIVRYPVTLD